MIRDYNRKNKTKVIKTKCQILCPICDEYPNIVFNNNHYYITCENHSEIDHLFLDRVAKYCETKEEALGEYQVATNKMKLMLKFPIIWKILNNIIVFYPILLVMILLSAAYVGSSVGLLALFLIVAVAIILLSIVINNEDYIARINNVIKRIKNRKLGKMMTIADNTVMQTFENNIDILKKIQEAYFKDGHGLASLITICNDIQMYVQKHNNHESLTKIILYQEYTINLANKYVEIQNMKKYHDKQKILTEIFDTLSNMHILYQCEYNKITNCNSLDILSEIKVLNREIAMMKGLHDDNIK